MNGKGDGAKGTAGVSCTVAPNECTLRAAIESANESVGTDEIDFDPAFFNGEPTDTLAAATQTLGGSTSGLVETTHLAEAPETGGGGGGGANGGGGGSSGGGSSASGSSTTATTTTPPATPVAPKVRITAKPRKSATATTAKFKFKAEPAAGAKFECKLDSAKWAKCSSPKTYKELKVGKHTFRVRATASGLTSPATVFKFTIKE